MDIFDIEKAEQFVQFMQISSNAEMASYIISVVTAYFCCLFSGYVVGQIFPFLNHILDLLYKRWEAKYSNSTSDEDEIKNGTAGKRKEEKDG